MNEWNDPELKALFRKHLIRGVVFLSLLIAFIFVLALVFEPQIRTAAALLTQRFGFPGLALVVFFADLIISPIPPDAALFFIGKSELHSQWTLFVPLLGFISTFAGVCGWFIGRKLQHLKLVKRTLLYFDEEHQRHVKRFGFWIVILGALTPLPFSLTCWLAGIFKLNFKTFVAAALFRVPRFVIYYWAIFYSGQVAGMIRKVLSENLF